MMELRKGDRLEASWLNRMVRAIVARTVNAGPGLRATRTPAGTTLSLAAPSRAQGGEGGAAVCRVTGSGAGLVLGRLPSGQRLMAFLVTFAPGADAYPPDGSLVLAVPVAAGYVPGDGDAVAGIRAGNIDPGEDGAGDAGGEEP